MVASSRLTRNRSIERAAAILDSLADNQAGVSASELSRLTRLPRPTVSRMLHTLARVGLVDRSERTDTWTVGLELVRMGRNADPIAPVMQRAKPILEHLADVTGEAAMLGIPVGMHRVDVVDQVDATRLIGVTNWVGKPFALHASAMGKVLLASLSEEDASRAMGTEPFQRFTDRTIVETSRLRRELATVRSAGYAETLGELEQGLSGIAVPVDDQNGRLRAILAVGGPAFRLTAESRVQALSTMKRGAQALAKMFDL
jgi:DNA-binding IclR family transcriptional regulator